MACVVFVSFDIAEEWTLSTTELAGPCFCDAELFDDSTYDDEEGDDSAFICPI